MRRGNIYTAGRHASAVIKGMKCARTSPGMCEDLLAELCEKFRASERAQIPAVLESLEFLPAEKTMVTEP